MVRHLRLVAAGLAVAMPIASFCMFIAAVLRRFPPLPDYLILFGYWSLQFVVLLIAPIASGLAIWLSPRVHERGWRLVVVRFVIPLVGLFAWVLAGVSVVVGMPVA